MTAGARRWLRALALTSALAVACSKGSDQAVPRSIAEALIAAEKSGAVPTLNRDDTVAGPDANGNGVRDDLDAYIDGLPDSDLQKAALKQDSAALTTAMTIDTTDQSKVLSAARQLARAINCLYLRYDERAAHNKGSEMEKLTVNTKVRFQAYEKYSAALSGNSFIMPTEDTCAAH